MKRHREIEDGDDKYIARRPIKRQPSAYTIPRKIYTRCEDCGGKMKPRGATGADGQTSSKCAKCGRRTYTKHYKGSAGLWDGR